ncbi:hypothetical protein [Serratia proteamaculans]|uniref:hypothetical protein n=1 Tax=Serratia proteamaculans TaxID=28151 RepID=UPI00217AC1AE|nr:hypothetical protein [Serratia proteamaculans]CAI1178655.1 Uncharacterised protein [Serratia proteamaculans]
MDKLESMVLEAETVSALMIHLANDDAGDASFAVMSDLGENGTEHECDLGVHETALRASAVIDQLLAELEAKDKRIAELERSLIDAGRERDDWVDHSSKMERRAIEAERKLATPIVAPDDGFDDCREMRPDSTNDFDTGYNFGLYRYEQNIRAAGFKCVGGMNSDIRRLVQAIDRYCYC